MSEINIGGGFNNSSLNQSTGKCLLCALYFKSLKQFARHLRDYHCTREGGSFVCRYGLNNVCPSLPLEGVSDVDYENHIARDHLHLSAQPGGK